MSGSRVELIRMSKGDSAAALARELFGSAPGMDGAVLLVLPDERLCREVRSGLAGGNGVVTTWVVTPWSLARELYTRMGLERPVVDRAARQLIVRKVMEDMGRTLLCPDGGPRPGMVRHVSRTIEELFLCGAGPSDRDRVSSERGKVLWELFTAYGAELRSRGLVDTGELPGSVLDALKDTAELPNWSCAGLYMLDDSRSSFNELLSFMIDKVPRSLIVEAVPGHRPSFAPRDAKLRPAPDDGTSVFSVPPASRLERSVIRSVREVSSITGQDWSEELNRAVRDIKRAVFEGGDPSSIGLMLPKERLRDPFTYEVLKRFGVPFDQGSSVRAVDVPVVKGLMDLVRSVDTGFPREVLLPALSQRHYGLKAEDGSIFSSSELEEVTREAYVLGGGKDPVLSWTRPIQQLSADPEKGDRLRETARKLSAPLDRLLGSLSSLRGQRRSVQDHLVAILDVWAGLGAFKLMDREEGEEGPVEGHLLAQRAFGKLLDAVSAVRDRSVIAGLETVHFKEVLDLLGAELSSSWIEEGLGQGGIRVLSYEDGVGMAFDRLYVLSLNEGSMPPREGIFSLLTDREMRLLGISIPSDRRMALERLCLALNSASMPLLGTHRTEGGGPCLISPFIEDLALAPVKDDQLPMSGQDVQRLFSELSDPLARALLPPDAELDPRLMDEEELLSNLEEGLRGHIQTSSRNRSSVLTVASAGSTGVLKDQDLLEGMDERFGPDHIWSATRLETLRLCPYRFMVTYVLGIEELREVVPEVGADKLGTIFHTAVERFHSNWKGRVKGRVLPSEVREAEKAMSEAVSSVLSRYTYSGPYWDAVKERLLGHELRPGMVTGFIVSESGYRGAFNVSRTELKFGMEQGPDQPPEVLLGAQVRTAGPSCFRFRGSIDRLDTFVLDKTASFIWDYKTGSAKVDRKGLQLPLYMLAASKAFPGQLPVGCGYYHVIRPGGIWREPVKGAEVYESDAPSKELIEGAAKAASHYMEEVLDTALDLITMARGGSFKPKERCSDRYCPLSDICRRGDL